MAEGQRLFKKFQQEEHERWGDRTAGGARYGYIYFRGARKVHPDNDRLSRMLLLSGASAEIVEAAKHLRCQICLRVNARHSVPQVSAKVPQRFNEQLGSDTFYVKDAADKK